jgi:hypothetical protein
MRRGLAPRRLGRKPHPWYISGDGSEDDNEDLTKSEQTCERIFDVAPDSLSHLPPVHSLAHGKHKRKIRFPACSRTAGMSFRRANLSTPYKELLGGNVSDIEGPERKGSGFSDQEPRSLLSAVAWYRSASID